MTHQALAPSSSFSASKIVATLLLLAAVAFFALHTLHLTADFPNHSPWMDWAKYTDEGWYGDAAIRHYQRGHWYVSGDFNPAVALPVWPALELIVFHFTGVTLAAARGIAVGVFSLILLTSYLLLRRWVGLRSLSPAVSVLLLAVSPFVFAFTRLAILEPLLILLTLLALLAIPVKLQASPNGKFAGLILMLGILLPLMVLTKTTAIFLFPSVIWLLWASVGYELKPFLRVAVPTGAMAAILWSAYFFVVVRPYFLEDYRYLFSANAYTGITADTAKLVLENTVRDGLWMGRIFYPLAIGSTVVALLVLRRRVSPLLISLLLWVAGYAAFLAYHNNLQPRYYLVLAVPLTLLLPLALEELRTRIRSRELRLGASVVTTIAIGAILIPDAAQTLRFVRTPEYTFVDAARRVQQIIAGDPTQNPLILSISGSDLSLMTGLPSICDDFGTLELGDRVAVYHPGWYIAWNQVDDDKMDALAPLYRLHRVAAFPAMDDPDRNLLILYRLDPAIESSEPKRKRKPIPRLLQTKLGQQPSVLQLEH